jgi:dCTP diphosphatase
MALIVEAAELVEQFQWLTDAESHQLTTDQHSAVQTELADILIYLVRIAGVGPLSSGNRKAPCQREEVPC